MYFFRTFKKSTAPYKVHNMGLRYIKMLRIRSKPFHRRDLWSMKVPLKWVTPACRKAKTPINPMETMDGQKIRFPLQ